MNPRRQIWMRWIAGLLLLASTAMPLTAADELRVMTWNIWHGGREDGEEVGPQRVADVIRDSKADIVAMQETYGSGQKIAKLLDFELRERGTNLSIHSRYPILEDISVFEKFKCMGALIQLPDLHQVAFYNVWLPYGEDIWLPGQRAKLTAEQQQKACKPSADDLVQIRQAIAKRLNKEEYRDVTIIVAGDFNSMSANDYADVATDQFGKRIQWKTSQVLTNEGFRDSYREANPEINRERDSTWTPRFSEQEQDRIDFIYYKSQRYGAFNADVVKSHAVKFPSDHAAVVTTFHMLGRQKETSIQAMTYNIKHGQGIDKKLALARTAAVIEKQSPSFVGLQEVDMNASRSGKVNQAAELGRKLGMHAAFGPFMDFQGGRYGMAVLSEYPIRSTESVALPTGNEPRVALAVEVLLPSNKVITIVNVHFDWVANDEYRFRQATALKDYLDDLKTPFVLLGDFNDKRGSRTLTLLSADCIEPKKSPEAPFTFPADKPTIEIDFIFAGPESRWTAGEAKVIEEPLASDHRPVIATLTPQ